jgi:hypothetical protein
MVPGRNYAAKVVGGIILFAATVGICKGWYDRNPPVTIHDAVIENLTPGEYLPPSGYHKGHVEGYDELIRFPLSVNEGDTIKELTIRKLPFSEDYNALKIKK